MESFLKRQEIRTISKKLYGYDIEVEGNKASLEVVISSIIQNYDPGDELAGVPAILNIAEEYIDDDLLDKIELLNINSVLIQINSRALADNTKTDIIRKIKDIGYSIVIEVNKEDTVFSLARTLADIIKFNIQAMPENILNGKVTFECKKLAYNVDSASDFVIAESANIDYYEGKYISDSSEVELKHSTHSKLNFIEIIAAINSDDCDIELISNIISRDALMSAQIIRLANSSYFKKKEDKRIKCVDDAVNKVGIQNLKRWLMLLQFSSSSRIPEETLQISYHRALFCKYVVDRFLIKAISPNDAYLIGLFSEIDVLSGNKMSAELYNLNLTRTVEDALLYRDGAGGKLLNLIKAYEEADNNKIKKYCSELNINDKFIFNVYYEAVIEAAELWKELTKLGGIK